MASGSGKRGRAEDGENDANDFVTKGELSEMLSKFKGGFAEDVTATLSTKCGARMEELIRTYDTMTQKRFGEQDANISDLNARTAKLEEDQKKMDENVQRLQAALAVAESTTAEASRAVADEAFDRAPDLTLVRVNASESVSHTVVKDAIKVLMTEADMKNEAWELLGNPAGIARNFTIKLCGAEGLAVRRAKKFMDLRRDAAGAWRSNPTVRTPLGRDVELFLSPDKSPKQLRTEQAGRKLLRAFRAVHPNRSVHLDKRAGTVSVDWVLCAKVVPNPEPGSTTVQWNVAALEQTGVSKCQIMSVFNSESGSAAGIQWQI